MVRPLLLGVLSVGVVDAFQSSPFSLSHHVIIKTIDDGARQHRHHNILPTQSQRYHGLNRLALANSDDISNEILSLDTELASEIEEALSLAQTALATDAEAPPAEEEEADDDEEEINDIANMLLEKPPTAPPAVPLPPVEEPPASIISTILEAGPGVPLPPQSPPTEAALELGEMLQKKAAEELELLQKKAAEELEKMVNAIFGLKNDASRLEEKLTETEAAAKEVEDVAAAIKKEIEESIKEREEMLKRTEEEFAKEKKSLVAQIEVASGELKESMDQSEQAITEAKSKATRGEKALLDRIASFKASIDEVTANALQINKEKEEMEGSKQSILGKVMEEGKNKLAKVKETFQFDFDYAKQVNAGLLSMAEEAESQVRIIYDQMSQMRTERISLSEQILDVEKNALEEIATLERELELDDERYAAKLQTERDRLDKVIDVAYQAYAIRICKKIVVGEAVEGEYKEKIRLIDAQVTAAKKKQAARVKGYLDILEEKHKKERIAIYQEKFEAVSAIRKQMNAQLSVEYAKMEDIHNTMKPKVVEVQEQTAQVKAEFEKAMAIVRQLAKEEEKEILGEIEDVRVDMTDKMKTQRRLYENKRTTYLEDMNSQISDADGELRQKWREVATVKQNFKEVGVKRDGMIDKTVDQQALIDSYESDRESFRTSLKLTAKVAREKIGNKTKRLLGRDKEKAP